MKYIKIIKPLYIIFLIINIMFGFIDNSKMPKYLVKVLIVLIVFYILLSLLYYKSFFKVMRYSLEIEYRSFVDVFLVIILLYVIISSLIDFFSSPIGLVEIYSFLLIFSLSIFFRIKFIKSPDAVGGLPGLTAGVIVG